MVVRPTSTMLHTRTAMITKNTIPNRTTVHNTRFMQHSQKKKNLGATTTTKNSSFLFFLILTSEATQWIKTQPLKQGDFCLVKKKQLKKKIASEKFLRPKKAKQEKKKQMQDQEIDDVNVAPNQKFCMILLQYLQVDRQSTGDQFPKLRHSIAWLATKMKKKKFTHVCKKMTETMRPIMTRLKKEGGDETLLLYAETNRVELFELMHLRQTYPGKLEEEKQKVWFTLNVLAQIIGHANIQNNAAVAPILRRAAALAEPLNSSNPMSDVDRVGNLVRSMVTDVSFGHQLKESLTSLIADPDRTSVIMDIMENSGLVNYEQRTRAENKFQKKKKADNAVTLHTASCDSCDGSCQEEKLAAIETVDEINEIANNMLANKKKFSSIEDFTASFGADDQNENSETKPQRGIGDVLAETMINVPKKNPEDMLPFLDLLSKNAEEDLQTKCELSNAASMLVTGNYKGLMENLGTIVTKLNKGSDGTSEANQEQESLPNPFADLGPDTDLSHVMQRLHNLTTDTFDA